MEKDHRPVEGKFEQHARRSTRRGEEKEKEKERKKNFVLGLVKRRDEAVLTSVEGFTTIYKFVESIDETRRDAKRRESRGDKWKKFVIRVRNQNGISLAFEIGKETRVVDGRDDHYTFKRYQHRTRLRRAEIDGTIS